MDQGLLTTLGRRNAQRICVRADVGILDETNGERVLGKLQDLSATGCCVATQSVLPAGRPLRLAFEFDPGAEPMRLHAELAWTTKRDGPRPTLLAGLQFTDLAGADFARLRDFIDQKLWEVQSFAASLQLFEDMNDLEKLLLATVLLDRRLGQGDALEDELAEGTLVIVREGTVNCQEKLPDGRTGTRRALGRGDLVGALPIDPRGATRLVLRAASPAALLIVPPDGFEYLRAHHAETAFKLIAAWALAVRDGAFVDERPRRSTS